MENLYWIEMGIIILNITIVIYLIQKRKLNLYKTTGLKLIIIGFVLLLIGQCVDIIDDFEKYNEIGSNLYLVFLEKGIGYFGGRLLIFLGALQWIPKIMETEANKNRYRTLSKTLDKQVKEKNEILKQAQELIGMGSMEIYPLENKVIMSKNMQRIYGVKKRVFKIEEIFNFIDNEDLERIKKLYKNALEKNRFDTMEYKINNSKGKTIYLENNWKPIYKDGKLEKILEVSQDITSKSRLECNLKEVNKKYEILFKKAPYGILLIDLDNLKVLDFNDKAYTQLEYTKEEFKDLSIYDYDYKFAKSDITGHIQNVLKYGEDTFRTKHKTKNNKIRDMRLTMKLINLDGKNLVYAVLRDITDIIKQQEQFKQYIEKAPYGILVSDKNGNFLGANEKIQEISGYTEQELLNMNLSDFHLDEKELIHHENLIKKGNINIETTLNKKDGKKIDVRIIAVKLSENRYLGFHEDITARKKRESDLLLKDKAIETSSNGIVFSDLKGNITYVNKGFLSLFEYEDENKVLGKNIIEFWKDNKKLRKLKNELLKNHDIDEELEGITQNNNIKNIQILASVVKDKDGNPLRIMGIFIDVTEKKIYREKLEKEKERAEIANKAKSEFLANMSHELRTPLTGILGFADILKDMELNEFQLQMIEMIEESGEHLLGLIKDILSFAQIDRGTLKINIEKFKLDDILGVLRKTLDLIIKKKSKRLSFNIIKENEIPKYIKMDKLKLKQILINLLSNAEKFTEEGKIELKIKYLEGNKIRFKVTDTGIGISEEVQKIIFDKFVQGEHYMTKKYEGTGLGLAITSKLIDLLGGELNLTSKKGEGSTFFVTLPTDLKNIEDNHKNNIKDESQGKKERVLEKYISQN
ncbi:MAG: PAS domain S-box protein [Fusobacteriota bacterium]